MPDEPRVIATQEDAEKIRGEVESFAEGGYGIDGTYVEWDDFLYKLEEVANIDLGTSMESPAIKAIKHMVRQIIADSV